MLQLTSLDVVGFSLYRLCFLNSHLVILPITHFLSYGDKASLYCISRSIEEQHCPHPKAVFLMWTTEHLPSPPLHHMEISVQCTEGYKDSISGRINRNFFFFWVVEKQRKTTDAAAMCKDGGSAMYDICVVGFWYLWGTHKRLCLDTIFCLYKSIWSGQKLGYNKRNRPQSLKE